MPRESLLNEITDHYLGSGDFNGIAVGGASEFDELAELVSSGLVNLVFGDRHPNPHILALDPEPIDEQLEKLGRLKSGCAYPSPRHLLGVVDRAKYQGKPYLLEIALGQAQLSHRAFELSVLEGYRNDPRYSYDSDDVHGTLSALSDVGLKSRDDTWLRFGFAYDDKFNQKYAAAYLRDLGYLTPEHQQIWRAKEIETKTHLHPDYFRTSIMGAFPERLSIYEAFIWELQTTNRMVLAMGKPPLFRRDYKDDSRPQHFASLLRPTGRELNQFVVLLDQLMSDNLNSKFFEGEVELETEHPRPDGKIEIRRKGTVQLLKDWLTENFRSRESEPLDRMFEAFREIRKLRNKPSHSIVEDVFRTEITQEQRELMLRAYGAVRVLRLILANHPAARFVEVDDMLFEGKIWPF
jgi:hypothetical protein